MVCRFLLILALPSFGAIACQDEVCSGIGSSMLQKMSAEAWHVPVTEEQGEQDVPTKNVAHREAAAEKASQSQKERVQGDGNPGKLRSNMHAHKDFEVEAGTFAEEVEKDSPAAGELVANRVKSNELQTLRKEAKSKKAERQSRETFDGDDHVTDDTENEETSAEALREAVKKAAAHADAAAPPVTPSATKTGWEPILDDEASVAADVVFAKGRKASSAPQGPKTARLGRGTFDGDDHATDDTENEESSDEALREAVKKAVAHSEAATHPVTPFATKTGSGQILNDEASVPADVVLPKESKAKKPHSERTSKETEVGSASTKTVKRMSEPDQDSFVAIEGGQRKSPQHVEPPKEGPLGQQEMKQPRDRPDAKKLSIENGAPAPKLSTKSGVIKYGATPEPHGAVTSPVNAGTLDRQFAKHAQGDGQGHDIPCKQADGCPEGGKR